MTTATLEPQNARIGPQCPLARPQPQPQATLSLEGALHLPEQRVSGTIRRTFPSIGPLSLSAEVLRLTHAMACISGEFLPAAEWFLLTDRRTTLPLISSSFLQYFLPLAYRRNPPSPPPPLISLLSHAQAGSPSCACYPASRSLTQCPGFHHPLPPC